MTFGPLGRDEGYRQAAGGNPHHPKEFTALHERFDRLEAALLPSDRPMPWSATASNGENRHKDDDEHEPLAERVEDLEDSVRRLGLGLNGLWGALISIGITLGLLAHFGIIHW